jgi:hypothetical protein
MNYARINLNCRSNYFTFKEGRYERDLLQMR